MIDLCQWFGKGMKKIYTYQMFLCFFEMASVINLYKATTALSLATNVVTCAQCRRFYLLYGLLYGAKLVFTYAA